MDESFDDFGNGQFDGEYFPDTHELLTARSLGLYGTARMEGVRGVEATKVGRGIRVGDLEGESGTPIFDAFSSGNKLTVSSRKR